MHNTFFSRNRVNFFSQTVYCCALLFAPIISNWYCVYVFASLSICLFGRFGRMKTYFIATKCNVDDVCMCGGDSVSLVLAPKRQIRLPPSDLFHSPHFPSRFFLLVSASSHSTLLLCMIPFHFEHCFHFYLALLCF